jgi:dienelactone hydrolase
MVVAAALLLSAGCGGSSDDDADSGEAADPTATTVPSTGVGDNSTTAPPTTASNEPLEVESITETFVDTSRPTAAGSQTPAAPDRTLETRIVYPTSGGPYPLIVLSHGLTGHPDEFTDTLPIWAAAGFVVAAPAFPLTNVEVPGGWNNAIDVANQPGDVSFVIDEVLAASGDPDSPLHDRVDADDIGVVGHSLGGATTWAVSFNTATRDERIDSTVIFAGVTLPMPGGEYELDSGLPLLVFHGDADDLVMDSDLESYQAAASPKWFVTLLGGDHVPPFTDGASPYDELVEATVLDFWHGTLDDDPAALDRIETDAVVDGLSTLDHG